MRQKVFVDTNFFCALYNPTDSLYQSAQVIRKHVVNWDLIVSNFILLETYTILSQRVSKHFAIQFGQKLLTEHPYIIIWVDKKLEESVWNIFASVSNKNFSYVDASILAVMQKEYIHHLLSFDRQFVKLQKKFHFTLLGI